MKVDGYCSLKIQVEIIKSVSFTVKIKGNKKYDTLNKTQKPNHLQDHFYAKINTLNLSHRFE